MKSYFYLLCCVIALLSPACTWIETTSDGAEVILVKAHNVETCNKLGTTTASVTYKVGPITRSEEKVREELITLARNKAAEMGGDSIVAVGPAKDGVMSFDIYQCAE
jgi:hypothetical protein